MRAGTLALTLWLLAVVGAAAMPQLGFMTLPRSCAGVSSERQIDQSSQGFQVLKVSIPPAFATDAADVRRALHAGITTVVLNSGGWFDGYDYSRVRENIERPGGVDGTSYADLMRRYPQVTFILEIGNEPDNDGVDPWAARWWALAVYKELALNQLGHIDQPWRSKYPNLQWAISLPTRYAQAQALLQWLPGDDLGSGGVRDYYDLVADHIYGWYRLDDGGGAEWLRIHQMLLGDRYTRAILISEFGIDDGATPYLVKAQRYRDFLAQQPAKVRAATAFTYCIDGWGQYSLGRDPAAVARYAGR